MVGDVGWEIVFLVDVLSGVVCVDLFRGVGVDGVGFVIWKCVVYKGVCCVEWVGVGYGG